MTNDDKKPFGDCMTALQVAFGQKPDVAVTAAYWSFLSDLDLDSLKVAVNKAGRSLKFFPRPSELRDLSGGESIQAQAALAWEAVRGAMDRYDYTTSVDFGPLVNSIVRNLGGWTLLCDKSIPDLVWVRKDFERLFAEFVDKTIDGERGSPLRGVHGGKPVRIMIGGKMPPLAIEAPTNGVSKVVRELAEAKGR